MLNRKNIAISALILGIGGVTVYKQYINDVALTSKPKIKPEIRDLIKKKTSLEPCSISYSIPTQNLHTTPQSLVKNMYSSWVMIPEKFLLWMTIPEYEPLTTVDEGKFIYGMFKVEASNPQAVILHWELMGMAGFHVFSITKEKTANFETIFWMENQPSYLLSKFHDIYSKLLIKAAV